jgi:hypothetical protein
MLLRRITAQLKRQDWFAVGIDFLIVVFGVFFGFQVTDWNQARQDRAHERGYISRISHDIARSREQVLLSNDAMHTQAEGATLVLQALDTCRVPVADRDAFARALYNIGKFDTATLDQTAIDELKSTGRSTVLRSIELRENLSALVRAIELQHRIEPQFRDRTSPFVNYIQSLVQFDVQAPIGIAAEEITWSRMRMDLGAACVDSRFRASVSAVRDMTLQIIGQNDDIVEQMDAAITLAMAST